jgi:hypothetical protein
VNTDEPIEDTRGGGGHDQDDDPRAAEAAGLEQPEHDREEDRAGDGGSRDQLEGAGREASGVPDEPPAPLAFPVQTPLFHAQHSDRYARQGLIREYEKRFSCRLIVIVAPIVPDSVTLLEELIHDADPAQDLHLMLDTPGGDGETAVRLVRSAQARCRELTVIVPNQAKSAGTILLIGAHHILMGPTSDLGPVDPQFFTPDRGSYSAKDLLAAVANAEQAIAENPDSYPLHVSLLADVTAVMVQQARSALGRSGDLVREALASHPDRSEEDDEKIAQGLTESLIEIPLDHSAVFGVDDAEHAGLPVIRADPTSDQWRIVWHLWTKYFALDSYVYEGRLASQVFPRRVGY